MPPDPPPADQRPYILDFVKGEVRRGNPQQDAMTQITQLRTERDEALARVRDAEQRHVERMAPCVEALAEANIRVRALEEAATEALTSLRTGPLREGYAASVLDIALHPDQGHVAVP